MVETPSSTCSEEYFGGELLLCHKTNSAKKADNTAEVWMMRFSERYAKSWRLMVV
jgi:hypothetical protein